MSFQAIVKDLGQIYQRLFDHSPALQGETRYFYSQFEEHPRSKEFDQLLQTSHLLNEAIDCEIEEKMEAAPFDKINTKLDTVAGMLERTVERGENAQSGYIKERKDELEADWAKFNSEIENKRNEVDQQYNTRMDELKEYFGKLEQQPPS